MALEDRPVIQEPDVSGLVEHHMARPVTGQELAEQTVRHSRNLTPPPTFARPAPAADRGTSLGGYEPRRWDRFRDTRDPCRAGARPRHRSRDPAHPRDVDIPA